MWTRSTLAFVSLLALACEAPADPDPDGGAACRAAAECDDGVFCNGAERCEAGACVGGAPPCAASLCDEGAARCEEPSCDTDADGDGFLAIACGGEDCDDDDPLRYPGATEVCDTEHRDEDCDPRTFGDVDADDDGAIAARCCNEGAEGLACGADCDDDDPTTSRTSPEVCDEVDNDCDSIVDEGLLVESWPDADGDGWGDASATPQAACAVPSGRVDRAGDCDDGDARVHPERDDPCDGVDQDCDGALDETPCAADAECVTPVDASAPACRVLRCASTGQDCNGDASDGCEAALCTSSAACGSCGAACTSCEMGVCGVGVASIHLAYPVDDASGAPRLDTTLELRGRCGVSFGVDPDDGAARWRTEGPADHLAAVRFEAPGHRPTIAVPGGGDTVPLFTDADVEAWRTAIDPPWTEAPHHGLLVVDVSGVGLPADVSALVEIDGPPRGVPVVVTHSDPERRRIVVPNVAPGTVRVDVVSIGPGGCGLSCPGSPVPFYLDAGTIGYVSFASCARICG